MNAKKTIRVGLDSTGAFARRFVANPTAAIPTTMTQEAEQPLVSR